MTDSAAHHEPADLAELPSSELYSRAVKLARDRHDVGFLWRLLREIPAGVAATGDVDRAKYDMLHVLSLLDEFTHAGEGELAEAMRPFYLDYLARHG